MSAAEITRRALDAVGKGASESGWCERFTRGLFGFPAEYATARLAYLASREDGPIHTDTSPPPGVPVYFDITAGPNRNADHVAVSVGGGYVVSTSVGPGKTVARVKITDFGRTIWPGAIRYTGWAEFYHGHRVYTPPTKDTEREDWLDMDEKKLREIIADEVRAAFVALNGATTFGYDGKNDDQPDAWAWLTKSARQNSVKSLGRGLEKLRHDVLAAVADVPGIDSQKVAQLLADVIEIEADDVAEQLTVTTRKD